MGKQINYWMGYEDFLQIGQAALEQGCIIIRSVSWKLEYGRNMDMITKSEHNYYFYVPEAGNVTGRTVPFKDSQGIGNYSAEGNTVIQAGYSLRNDEKRELCRNGLFVISGYYDSDGEYVPRPMCVTKVYNKLVRIVKKVAPYTELTDTYISMKEEDYLQKKEWRHKEYISSEFLRLRTDEDYKLI